MKQKILFALAAVALLVAFVGGGLYFTGQKQQAAEQRTGANRDALVRMHSPSHGPQDAPVEIVEFIDPACETCRDFYFQVKQDILAGHPDRIRLVVRYAPFHTGSDQVVAVLEAARKQGKFWPALEALLAGQEQWVVQHTAQVDKVWPLLAGLGLDLDRVRADMAAPEIASLIRQDLADAAALNVTMTPEYFVNGRPLPSFGYEQLKGLVEEALVAAQ